MFYVLCSDFMSETDRLRAALSGIEDALHAAKLAGDPSRIQHFEKERIKLRSILAAHNPAFADTVTQTQRIQADLVAMNYGFVVQRFNEVSGTFVRPAFDVQKPPNVARPKKAVVEEWFKTLYNQRLLLIHAPDSMDCEPLARFLAASFQQVFNKKYPSRTPIQAVEWNYEHDVAQLTKKLADVTDSVIVFRELFPHQIQHSLDRLINLLQHYQQFAIILTALPRDLWNLGLHDSSWIELDPATMYNDAGLAELLLHYVYINRDDFKHQVIRDQLHVDYPLLNQQNETIREIASTLGNPSAVATFSQLLAGHNGSLNLTKLIQDANTAKPLLQTWFYGRLNERERLLAIGMSMFEGCYDDQFFAAFNAIAAAGWAKRDGSLNFIEYSDLDNLSGFFRFVRYGAKATPKMYGMISQQRFQILAMAWQTHRRLLLTALPVLLTLVEQSTAPVPTQNTLFGTSNRIATLRNAISDTLSDVARIAQNDHTFHEIELMLVDWMTHSNDTVQAVAGKAIARWRVFGEDSRCFDLLDAWYVDAGNRLKEYVNYRFKQTERDDDGFMALQSAIAVIVGYAALLDRANAVDRRITDWIDKLLPQNYRLVRSRFQKYIVEQAMANHIRAFSGELRTMASYTDAHGSIGTCVSQAYKNDNDGTIQLLHQWYQDCVPTGKTNAKDFGKRELLVLAYIEMLKQLMRSGIASDEIQNLFELLGEILQREQHPEIRKAATLAIINQAKSDFDTSQQLMHQYVVGNLSKEEYASVVENITSAYLQQRQAEFYGGDHVLALPSGKYQIWNDQANRRQTAAESAMAEWLRDPKHGIANKIAIDAMIGFSKALDLPEAEYLDVKQKEAIAAEIERKKKELEVKEVKKPTITMQQRFDKLVFWLATFSLKYRAAVTYLLEKEDSRELRFLLERWRKGGDSAKRQVAHEYDRAKATLKNRRGVLIGLGVFMLILVVLVIFALVRLI